MNLTEWARANEPDPKYFAYKAYWDQIKFVRDILPRAFFEPSQDNYSFIQTRTTVIESHMSKSVVFPVYRLELLDGTEIIMRNNLTNWMVSINSPKEMNKELFIHLFDTKTRSKIDPVYCEGIPADKVYGPYSKNHSAFTFVMYGNYDLYTFFWLYAHQPK